MANPQDRTQQNNPPRRDEDVRRAPSRDDQERPREGQERREDDKHREDMERR